MRSSGKRGYKYGYKYGVGFPSTFGKLITKRVPSNVADKLNLYVFLVNENGKVSMYDWRKLKQAQSQT